MEISVYNLQPAGLCWKLILYHGVMLCWSTTNARHLANWNIKALKAWSFSKCKKEGKVIPVLKYYYDFSDYKWVLDWWLNLLHSMIQRVTTIYRSLLHTQQCTQSRLHCRCLVAASNDGCSRSSGFPKCPRPQLRAFSSDSSQWPNPRSSQTNSN
jgi:hypothetical protein